MLNGLAAGYPRHTCGVRFLPQYRDGQRWHRRLACGRDATWPHAGSGPDLSDLPARQFARGDFDLILVMGDDTRACVEPHRQTSHTTNVGLLAGNAKLEGSIEVFAPYFLGGRLPRLVRRSSRLI